MKLAQQEPTIAMTAMLFNHATLLFSHATPQDNDVVRWLCIAGSVGEILTAAPRRMRLPPLPFRFYT